MSKPFNYGGQAVIEGVMMRGKKHMAVAVRNPDGDIVLHTEPLNPRIYSSFINKVPFIRGFTLLWDTLVLGMRTLMYSAMWQWVKKRQIFQARLPGALLRCR